jgi:glycosyltransferase involved in cell wall biosynthesis
MQLGIFATHPIQYHVPWFRAISKLQDVNLTVFFDHLPDSRQQGIGFGTAFKWDLPLLEGYDWQVCSGKAATGDQWVSLMGAIRSSDVVLVTGWQDPFLIKATLLAFLMRRPVIVRGESSALKPRPFIIRLIHRLYLKLFDKFLTIGHANKIFYLNNGIQENRLHLCRYFVDNERFDHTYQKLFPNRRQLRNKFGIPREAVCFLFAGKFVDKKRPLDLLRAFQHLNHRSDVHLLMVGDGALWDKARIFASRYEMSVTFTGFLNQSEIGKAYTAADVLVLPSDYDETWGLVVNEAMIFENPAIVSDRVGCGPDLIDDERTGYLFPFGNVNRLAATMNKLTDNRLRKRMGRKARIRVLERYTVEKAVHGTVQALANVS